MQKLIIKGGNPISGKITPVANKNSILKLIPACILLEGKVKISNVPHSTSVKVMLDIFKDLGGKIEYLENNTVILDSKDIKKFSINDELASKERAGLMFLGPLVSRFGQAEVKDSGGCKLGVRPLDTMFQGLKSLGIEVSGDKKYSLVAKNGLNGTKIWLVEASVTGTENLILAAVKAKGITEIYNAACEPHTQDLCNFLVSCGAKISGIGSNRLFITGVEKLVAPENFSWKVISDHIDIGGLIVSAAITGGEIEIEDAIPEHMVGILQFFEKINLKYAIIGNSIKIPQGQDLKCNPNFKGDMDKIPDQVWPGYPVDLIPQAIVLACFAPGNIRIHSIMYETQLFFIEELMKMNGKVHLSNPHTVITLGPSKFRGAKINCPEIIQSAHALVTAALAASGETTLHRIDPLMRRYPDLVDNLKKLGADIEIVED